MVFRYLLILIAVILAVRILRWVWARLFPPFDAEGNNNQSTPSDGKTRHTIDYKDVKDAKFKDL